jgi:hypothetical protein
MKIPELTDEEKKVRLGERTRRLIQLANDDFTHTMERIKVQEAAAKSKRDNAIRKLQSECEHKDDGGFMHGFCVYCGEGGA